MGKIVGAALTSKEGLVSYIKDLLKGKLSNITKIINVKTAIGMHIYLTRDTFLDYSKMLGDVKYNYDKLHGNSAGAGVKVISTHVSVPVHGGVGYNIYEFFDIKTNKRIGGGSF